MVGVDFREPWLLTRKFGQQKSAVTSSMMALLLQDSAHSCLAHARLCGDVPLRDVVALVCEVQDQLRRRP